MSLPRSLYIPHIIRFTRKLSAHSLVRVWIRNMAAQGSRPQARCLYYQVDSVEGSHNCCVSLRRRHGRHREYHCGKAMGFSDAISHRDIWPKFPDWRSYTFQHYLCALDENEDLQVVRRDRRSVYSFLHMLPSVSLTVCILF